MRSDKTAALLASAMAAAVAGSLAAAPARADTFITATYTGTVTQLLDLDGLVGAPIGVRSPSDLTFTDVFKFDLDKGARLTNPVDGHPADNLLGGSAFGGSMPLISSILTINGVAIDFLGTFASQEFSVQGNDIQSVAEVNDAASFRSNFISVNVNAPELLTTPFSGTPSSDFGNSNAVICNNPTGFCTDERFDAFLAPTSVSIVISVPEPASWALMILGFGAAGAALRRRQLVAGA